MGQCEVIIAEFVYGPVRCGNPTDIMVEDPDPAVDEQRYVCEEHDGS